MKVKQLLENAVRHLENAKAILKEKGKKEGRFYTDDKYVSIAGHTAYRGVLLALNELMKQHGISKRTRKNVDDYRDFIAKQDRKMLNYFNLIYEQFHLVMGYDGIGNVRSVSEGFECAEELIEWVNNRIK
ncbi:MAG: hypothetical protein KatS3mg027_0266 [Bacteroidia bacterium]|nr:MAG: hypothetical protein KatS3mg027_0266 [Bacteroidia bacterium]